MTLTCSLTFPHSLRTWRTGAADEPGAAEADRDHLQDQVPPHLHQPSPAEGEERREDASAVERREPRTIEDRFHWADVVVSHAAWFPLPVAPLSQVGVIFGSNEVTTGGTALRFYSSVRGVAWHTHKTRRRTYKCLPRRRMNISCPHVCLCLPLKQINQPHLLAGGRCGWRSVGGRSSVRTGRTSGRAPG